MNLLSWSMLGYYIMLIHFRLFELHNDLLARDSNSTTALLQRLFNNYELDVAVPDVITAEHEQEQLDFLRAVMNTRVMKLSMRFLAKKGKLPKITHPINVNAFRIHCKASCYS